MGGVERLEGEAPEEELGGGCKRERMSRDPFSDAASASSCRQPFPPGDRVTFNGKECVCQKCSLPPAGASFPVLRSKSRLPRPIAKRLFLAAEGQYPP